MKIKEIQLRTRNLGAIATFYHQQLGFKIQEESADTISFKSGSNTITFIATDKVTHPYHFAFNIPSGSIRECYEFFKDKLEFIPNIEDESIHPPIYDFVNWKAEALYFYDPDHNILEFTAREPIQCPLNGTFGYHDILYVSEMGIVNDGCMSYAKMIKERYGMEAFSRSVGRDEFYTMGDDEGLLILAKQDRIWYATDFKAEKQASRIIFEHLGKTHEIITNS